MLKGLHSRVYVSNNKRCSEVQNCNFQRARRLAPVRLSSINAYNESCAIMKLCIFLKVALLGAVLSGCKSDPEKFSDHKAKEPSKVQYCVVKTEHYLNNSYNDVLKCIKKTSDEEITKHNQRERREKESRFNAFIGESIQAKQVKDQEDRVAGKELSLIEAKIRAFPGPSAYEEMKLKYCRTKPDWRQHGVLIARELEPRLFSQPLLRQRDKPDFLRKSVILSCFNSASKEDVLDFYDTRLRKVEELISQPE